MESTANITHLYTLKKPNHAHHAGSQAIADLMAGKVAIKELSAIDDCRNAGPTNSKNAEPSTPHITMNGRKK